MSMDHKNNNYYYRDKKRYGYDYLVEPKPVYSRSQVIAAIDIHKANGNQEAADLLEGILSDPRVRLEE